MNIQSEYYRPLEKSMEHYGIDSETVPFAAAQLQGPEDAMFGFVMFLLM